MGNDYDFMSEVRRLKGGGSIRTRGSRRVVTHDVDAITPEEHQKRRQKRLEEHEKRIHREMQK